MEDSAQDHTATSPRTRGVEQRHCVTDLVAYGIAILSLVVAAYAAWHTYRRRDLGNPLFYAVGVVEIVLVGLLIGGSIALASTSRDVDGVLFISYLLTMIVIPPAAVLWAIAEKSRWGTGVVVVSMLTIAALSVRLLGIWKGTYV
jgi:H+/gluconate symporter-like permease